MIVDGIPGLQLLGHIREQQHQPTRVYVTPFEGDSAFLQVRLDGGSGVGRNGRAILASDLQSLVLTEHVR